MRVFTYFILLVFLPVFSIGQNPVFNWVEVDFGTTNNLQKMTVNGSEAVMAGYGNTFLKSMDSGITWKDASFLKPAMGYMDVSIMGNTGYLVSNREKLYDATPDVYKNGVIYKTSDAGATWSLLDLSGLGAGVDPAVDPNALLAYGFDFQAVECVNDSVAYVSLRYYEFDDGGTNSHSGVLKTTDSGATWKSITGDLGSSVITCISFADTVGYMGGLNMLYKTTTSSDTVTSLIANLVSDSKAYVSDITVIDKDELYVATTGDGAFHSTDGGATFTNYSTLGANGGWDILPINDSTLVFVGGTNKSRVSTDSGATWADCLLGTSIWEIAGVMNDSLFVLAKADIYKIALTDLLAGNYTWVTQTIGADNLQKAYIFNENSMMIVGGGGLAKITSDKGMTWTDIDLPYAPGYDDDMDFSGLTGEGNVGYACFNRFKLADYPTSSDNEDIYFSGGVFVTTDNWETFDDLDMAKLGKDEGDDPSKNPQMSGCNAINPQVIAYLGDETLLLWARWYDLSVSPKEEHSRIFKTTDGGSNWKVVSDDFGKSLYVQDMKVNGDTVYVGGNQIFMKSVDKGETFTDMYANLDEGEDDKMFVNSITLGDDGEVFVTTSVDGVLMSANGGNTFTAYEGLGGANDFYKFDQNSFMAIGTTSKSYFTNDGGTNWENCAAPSTVYEIGGVMNDSLYALGRGKYFKIALADLDMTTAVSDLAATSGVKVLYQPTGVLVVSEKNIDQCILYNITGRMVRNLKPNSTTCKFSKGEFATGIYFISTITNGKRSTHKVIL